MAALPPMLDHPASNHICWLIVMPHQRMKGMIIDPLCVGIVFERNFLSFKINPDVVSFIPGLFVNRSPATIAGLVVAVIVDAVERFPLWAFAHVAKKGGKTIAPFFAHGDPAASPSGVIRVAFIKASCLSPDPTAQGFTPFANAIVAVRNAVSKLEFYTSATGRVAVPEIAEARGCLSPAITLAKPERNMRIHLNAPGRYEATKPRPGQIQTFHGCPSDANQRGNIAQKRGFENVARIIKR